MAKLWDKGEPVDRQLEAFTTGDDYLLDRRLVGADCAASVAHVRTLAEADVLSKGEAAKLVAELRAIAADTQFAIRPVDEDCHTAIENRLVDRLGDLGKKVHACRSRNDQVIAALRLYAKAALHGLFEACLALGGTLRDFARQHRDVPMVGRTHTQPAMPSSVGLWAGAWLESLLDDLRLLQAAYELNDQCPLGSAASYGVPLDIDREFTSRQLGFARLQNNVLYANNSRGKTEAAILGAAAQLAIDLSRVAQDLITFSLPEFGYFRIPAELCTGSSIMPQKRNPCGLELVRAKASTILACHFQVLSILKGLPSGYNRDLQETKRPFLQGLDLASACVRVVELTFAKLEVCEERLLAAFTPEVFATDEALRLVVEEGMPFRDAYRQVADSLGELEDQDPRQAIARRTHAGGPANLGLELADEAMADLAGFLDDRRGRYEQAMRALLGSID
ncbi:MAG: argininosuccinate lyase [Candidatus Brocadiia bacterium]